MIKLIMGGHVRKGLMCPHKWHALIFSWKYKILNKGASAALTKMCIWHFSSEEIYKILCNILQKTKTMFRYGCQSGTVLILLNNSFPYNLTIIQATYVYREERELHF